MHTPSLPTDALLLRVRCAQPDLAPLTHTVKSAPACLALGARLCRAAWSSPSSIAYLYLKLPTRTALPPSTMALLRKALCSHGELAIARLALMHEIPGASHGQHAHFHYVVEMTPEASWEVELQRWYDCEHLPGLASVPGCVHAQRYWNYDEGPQSLACYDLVDQATLGCAEWLAVRSTEWSSRMRPRFQHTNRTMFALHGEQGL